MTQLDILLAQHGKARTIIEAADPQPWQAIFLPLVTPSQLVKVEVRAVAIVGRQGDGGKFSPHFNLAEFGGKERGVSRQHAVLVPFDGNLILMDLGSRNGTSLGGQILEPWHPYILRSGDYVEFGHLPTVVHALGVFSRTASDDDTIVPGEETES